MTEESPYLLGKSSTLPGRRFPLEGSRIIIGRDPAQCQIVVNNQAVGKRHAAIEVDATRQVKLIDLNSANGTFVNTQQITEQTRCLGRALAKIGDMTRPRIGQRRGCQSPSELNGAMDPIHCGLRIA